MKTTKSIQSMALALVSVLAMALSACGSSDRSSVPSVDETAVAPSEQPTSTPEEKVVADGGETPNLGDQPPDPSDGSKVDQEPEDKKPPVIVGITPIIEPWKLIKVKIEFSKAIDTTNFLLSIFEQKPVYHQWTKAPVMEWSEDMKTLTLTGAGIGSNDTFKLNGSYQMIVASYELGGTTNQLEIPNL